MSDYNHEQPLASVTADPFLGKTLDGRYRIEAEIGVGGMGKVYRATDLQLDRTVAIKLLHPWLASRELVIKRFHNEAKVLTTLDHPTIVRTYAMGLCDDAPFIVMELVEGVSLDDWLRQRKHLDLDSFAAIFGQVLAGVSHAHDHGVVHRDLKPSNILLSATAGSAGPLTVKLLDFGIAKILETGNSASMDLTQTGSLLGSPAYMSPEQSNGIKSDNRSDIYSLACVMYAALTGTPPFSGDNPLELLYKQVHEEPPDLVTTQGIPVRLAQVIHQGLQKDPGLRQQSVAQLAADVTDALADRSVITSKSSKKTIGSRSGQHTAGSSSRKRTIVATALAAVAVAAATGCYSMFVALDDKNTETLTGSPAEIVKTYLDTKPGPVKWEEAGDYALRGGQIGRVDYNAAMAAYGTAATDYAALNDRQAAMRCVKKTWDVINTWRPYKQNKYCHNVLCELIRVPIKYKEWNVATEILGEWQRQDASIGDAEDTLAQARALMALVRYEQGRPQEADALAESAYDVALKAPQRYSKYRFTAFLLVSEVAIKLKNESLVRRSAKAMEEHIASEEKVDPTARNNSYMSLAKLFSEINDVQQKERYFQLVIDSDSHDRVWYSALKGLGDSRSKAGDYAGAEKLFRRAQNEMWNGRSMKTIGFSSQLLGGVLCNQGKWTEAENEYKRALTCYSVEAPERRLQTYASIYLQLADICKHTGHTGEERKWAALAEDYKLQLDRENSRPVLRTQSQPIPDK